MRKLLIIVLIFAQAVALSSCGEKEEVGNRQPPVQFEYGEPHPARMITALELGWGNGDYEVGYINKEFEEIVKNGEEGTTVGPNNYCVDGEESIYIDDTMNYRILKYDRDGRYLGKVPKNRFTSHMAVGGLYVLPGPDCIYLYEIMKNTIYRYRFQDDELQSINIPSIGGNGRIHKLHAVYDGLGNSYFADMAYLPGENQPYFMIDSAFSGVIRIREIPFAAISYVDDLGNFYVVDKTDPNPDSLSLYMIDSNDNVSTIRVFPSNLDENPDQVLSLEPIDQNQLMTYFGFYLSMDGRLVERIMGSGSKTYQVTRNVNVYWFEKRYYEYDDKRPFRVYRVEVDWGQLN